jgi:hypothetical protein
VAGYFVEAPNGKLDYLSTCTICGAVVQDSSNDGKSTWKTHYDYHAIRGDLSPRH